MAERITLPPIPSNDSHQIMLEEVARLEAERRGDPFGKSGKPLSEEIIELARQALAPRKPGGEEGPSKDAFEASQKLQATLDGHEKSGNIAITRLAASNPTNPNHDADPTIAVIASAMTAVKDMHDAGENGQTVPRAGKAVPTEVASKGYHRSN